MKKVLSALLATVMLFTAVFAIPFTAQAADTTFNYKKFGKAKYGEVYHAYNSGDLIDQDFHYFKVPAKGTVTIVLTGVSDVDKKHEIWGSFFKKNKNKKYSRVKDFKTKFKSDYTGGYSYAKKKFKVKKGQYCLGIGAGYYDITQHYTVKIYYKRAKKKSKAPKATSINYFYSESNYIYVQWDQVSNVTGYVLQYSTSKNFKKKKSVKTYSYQDIGKYIPKLKKGKKYYFRVRTFNEKGSKTSYSKWSKTRAFVCK